MYEFMQLTAHNFYIESPAKVGVITFGEGEALVLDSGNNKDAGKKVLKILREQNLKLSMILNTHSHADHIGGNQYLQKQTDCCIYAPGIERDFTVHPILEAAYIYGANPPAELKHKSIVAQESDAQLLTADVLPEGLQIISLPGHSFAMVGIKTDEDVLYLADALSSAETLEKYQVGFIVDVGLYLQTLEAVKTMQAAFFVPSHAAVTEDIAPLAQLNIDKVHEVGSLITDICKEPRIFEEVLQQIFAHYGLTMTFEQHALVGSTVRSYLTWLKESGALTARIENNRLLWERA